MAGMILILLSGTSYLVLALPMMMLFASVGGVVAGVRGRGRLA